MRKRDDLVTLLDIDRAARDVLSFTKGVSAEQFAASPMIQSAVYFKILVIGEAVKRLTPEFRERNPQISWKEMAGARDRLIHGYDNIRADRVWGIVELHLPRLVEELEPLLPHETD